MVRIGCGRELLIPGVTRELDRPEYAHLGPGCHNVPQNSCFRSDGAAGVPFTKGTGDRFGYSPGISVPETSKPCYDHMGPGAYTEAHKEWTKPTSRAPQPSYEFGGNSKRFEGWGHDHSQAELQDPESLTKDFWTQGPVIFAKGLTRKSDRRPFLDTSWKPNIPTPPESPMVQSPTEQTSPFSPRLKTAVASTGNQNATYELPVKPARSRRELGNTRRTRNTRVSYAILQQKLQQKRENKTSATPKARSGCLPDGTRPVSAHTRSDLQSRPPFRVSPPRPLKPQRPQTARLAREAPAAR